MTPPAPRPGARIRALVQTQDLRTNATRVLSVFAVLVGLIWVGFGVWTGQTFVILCGLWLVVASVTATTISIVLNETMGRMLWFFAATLLIQFAHLGIHAHAHIDQLYASILTAVFLNFSYRKEKVALAGVLGFILVNFLVGVFLGGGSQAVLLGGDGISDAMAIDVLAPLSTATTIIAVAISVAVFSGLAERYYTGLRQAQADAEAASKAKSMFLASMSHEIRTPMNGVLGMAEILAASDLPPATQRNVGIIRESALSLLRIIDDILDMSSIEAGRLTVLAEPFDLLGVIDSTVDSLRGYADQSNVGVSVSLSRTVPRMITGDAVRLRQIIVNLMGNAIKFSRRPPDEPAGRVVLRVETPDEATLRLHVSDDGVGIAPEFLPQLFKPFVRSEAVTTRRYGGTGLGLAIVHELVGKMNGSIAVKSRLGEGSVFTVAIPMVNPLPDAPPPRLPGHRFMLCGLSDLQLDFWSGLLEGTGARLISVDAPQALDRLAQELATDPDRCTAVFTRFGARGAMVAPLDAAARQRFSDLRMVIQTRDRSEPSRLLDPDTFMLQSVPALRSDGLQALRALGLVNPEDAPDRTTPERVDMAEASQAARILLVEDNEINQIVLTAQLRKLGHQPTVASDGREALAIWQAGAFDLILTDCHMPEMDGYELARAIRTEERLQGRKVTPIVAISANAQPEQAARCEASGMNGILTKPVAFPDLSAMILRQIGQ